MNVADLSDDTLVAELTNLVGSERRILAGVIAHLVELEGRRLHLEAACSSLFDFCTRKLRLSEGAAFRRITAARLVRRFPRIHGMLERGEIHLSALVVLRKHLTDDNCETLLREATGKSTRRVEQLLAARFPRPDVPPSIRRLPTTTTSSSTAAASSAQPPGAHLSGAAFESSPPARDQRRRSIEPLSMTRHRVQFTASSELREKLERATCLMSHRNPDADLAIVVERAVDLLIVALEKERLGRTKSRGKKTDRHDGPDDASLESPATRGRKRSSRRYISRDLRRAVIERDGEQCSFVSATGERCPARRFLELDHIRALALGGTTDIANLRLVCRAHNHHAAERAFGRDYVERKIRNRRRKTKQSADPLPTPAAESPDASVEGALRDASVVGPHEPRIVTRDEPNARPGTGPDRSSIGGDSSSNATASGNTTVSASDASASVSPPIEGQRPAHGDDASVDTTVVGCSAEAASAATADTDIRASSVDQSVPAHARTSVPRPLAVFADALEILTSMGLRPSEALRAIANVRSRCEDERPSDHSPDDARASVSKTPRVDRVVSEALAFLTAEVVFDRWQRSVRKSD